MEDAAVPSDNAVSPVTLTTAASNSDMLITRFCIKLAEACSLFLASASSVARGQLQRRGNMKR